MLVIRNAAYGDENAMIMYMSMAIDPFHVRENVSKLEDKTKEILVLWELNITSC